MTPHRTAGAEDSVVHRAQQRTTPLVGSNHRRSVFRPNLGGFRGSAFVDDGSPFLVCMRCRDRIGVFEALWVELSDGTIHPTSFLNLGKHLRNEDRGRARFWHDGCLAPDAIPNAAEP